MVGEGFTVMAIAPEGKVFASLLDFLAHLKHDLLAELIIISNHHSALAAAQTPFPIPTGVPEWLSPLVAILPAQLFAYHLTLAKGLDPDNPRTINKVTETH